MFSRVIKQTNSLGNYKPKANDMLEFIQLLKQRYQTVRSSLDPKHPYVVDYQQRIDQLLYCEAYLRKGQLKREYSAFPLQIAVIGPTQAGKSSVVNVLLNSTKAGVSPLAGFTVHPHGYCHAITQDHCQGLQTYFGRFQNIQETSLNRTRYDCYSLSDSPAQSQLLPPAVVWDTPDFDSIDAADYSEGVIRTIALADIIVLVLSKEKYADQTVWDVIKTIAPLNQPTIICLNKLNEGNETVLVNSLKQRWQQYRSDPVPKIVPLAFQQYGTLPTWPAQANQTLHELAASLIKNNSGENHKSLIRQYWQAWLEPVYAEHQAQQQWNSLVDQVLKQALTNYQRDYLNHPYHYDSFQQALLNMLKLLEIPAISKAMSSTRRFLTWPVRQLMSLGKSNSAYNSSHELTVLSQIGEHVLIQLADLLAEKADTDSEPRAWWKDISLLLRQNRQNILVNYQRSLDAYQVNFEHNIEDAAEKLYKKLQQQPVTLNSLRATRFTADTAGMLLALQTGGIGVHDLFLTPVMLSITSLLAESAIGSYMNKVEADLRTTQLVLVRDTLIQQGLADVLAQLPSLSVSTHRFAISEEICSQAEQQLHEKKHGLRIL